MKEYVKGRINPMLSLERYMPDWQCREAVEEAANCLRIGDLAVLVINPESAKLPILRMLPTVNKIQYCGIVTEIKDGAITIWDPIVYSLAGRGFIEDNVDEALRFDVKDVYAIGITSAAINIEDESGGARKYGESILAVGSNGRKIQGKLKGIISGMYFIESSYDQVIYPVSEEDVQS